jgi:peptidoglycan hydrolase-like protein with peptidoglycan-binding domain
VVLSGSAILAAVAAGALYAVQDDAGPPARRTSALPTAAVTRTDMINTTEVDGTLGHVGSRTVLANGGGQVTWLPRAGTEIRRGDRVYGVDGHSVPLFYGQMPFWRELKAGMSEGLDVQTLERNLDALGYGDHLTVDRTFTSATTAAVKAWQKHLGVRQTGTVKLGDVVIQRGPIRVNKVSAIPGAPAQGPLLTASDTKRRITVNLPVSDQGIVRVGAKVRVKLPGGKATTGYVSSVGTVATAGPTNSQSQTGDGTRTATIPVYVALDGESGTGNLDGAPATVGFTSTEHKNVLAVPINSLLASAGGSYSVNVVDAAGNVRSVPVKLGIFDGDDVEVSGELTPGMKVQVPRS